MRVNGLIIWITVLCALLFCPSFAVNAQAESAVAYENWQRSNIVGSWETAIDINEDAHAVITRVQLNGQGDAALNLRELMAGLGYDVEWNGSYRYIGLNNGGSDINIFVDAGYCVKNGERIGLNGTVFIDDGHSYCSLSFLENILGVETVSIDKSPRNNRINGIALYAPELPPSSRKPFPETALSVDGMPLYIDYADNLMESLPYDTAFLVCEGINGKSENVIIYTEAALRNFKIISVKYNETGGGFTEGGVVLAPREIAPPLAVKLITTIPEGVPAEAITFTDVSGKTYSYALGYNGKDGSVSAVEVTLE